MKARCALVFLTLAAGADAGSLTPERALQRRAISDLRLSPDGARLAFVVAEPVQGAEQNRDVYLLDAKTGEVRRLTHSPKSDTHPRWSPEGKKLAFLSDRGEHPQIYILPLEGGEASPLTETKSAIESFVWSPNGERILFLAPPPKTEEMEKKEKEKDDARVEDRDELRPRLWTVEVGSGTIRQVSQGEFRIKDYLWTSDGKRVLFSGSDHPQPEIWSDAIFSLSVADGVTTVLYRPRGPFGGLKLSLDGNRLAFVGSRDDGPGAHDLYMMTIGEEPRNLSAKSIDRPIEGLEWLPDGSLLALASTGFTSRFYVVDGEGKARPLPPMGVSTGAFAGTPGRLYFVGQKATSLPEIHCMHDASPAERVTHLNSDWDDVELTPLDRVEYTSFDGKRIEAGLLKPSRFQKGTRVPLVVLVHGGPSGVWADRFEPWGQLLVARGFAVLYPNIRGSLGYGHDFLGANRRDWGGGDFKDVMAGVDYAVREGIADPEKLGIGGWSYGGYLSAWAVTQETRFKAAVSGAPMTDLSSEYGTESASINSYDTWYLGTPYENLPLFIERSPITHVKNARTPTLILCGEKDTTDPIGQCQQFYRGLKRYNVETELVLYPREGHGIREEKHQVDVLRRVVDWFEKRVSGATTSN